MGNLAWTAKSADPSVHLVYLRGERASEGAIEGRASERVSEKRTRGERARGRATERRASEVQDVWGGSGSLVRGASQVALYIYIYINGDIPSGDL